MGFGYKATKSFLNWVNSSVVMGLFDDVLAGNQTLFRNPVALEYDYMPKEVPYRESEQHYVAECIKPLFVGRTGRNLMIHGPSGVGKTLAVKSILAELQEESDEIIPLFVNCWQKRTSYKIMIDLCEQLDYKFIHNKNTEELFDVVKRIVNKKSAVFVFDEIDRAEDSDFLYYILEQIYRKTILLISNFESWAMNLDMRIKSRLNLDSLEFKKYKRDEILGIIRRRIESAFYPGVWQEDAINKVADATLHTSDVRFALFLLNESGNIAEARSSKIITSSDVSSAIKKASEFSVKPKGSLDESDKLAMGIVKDSGQIKIGEAYRQFVEKGGKGTYKTFQRRIKKLEQDKFINIEKINGGAEGKTSILKPADKKITDFKQQ